jgi:hypothetical protein
MIALYWLNSYPTEEQLSGSFSINKKTARRWIWVCCHAIHALCEQKVGQKLSNVVLYFYFTISNFSFFARLPFEITTTKMMKSLFALCMALIAVSMSLGLTWLQVVLPQNE